jgi:hypothetical protein
MHKMECFYVVTMNDEFLKEYKRYGILLGNKSRLQINIQHIYYTLGLEKYNREIHHIFNRVKVRFIFLILLYIYSKLFHQ